MNFNQAFDAAVNHGIETAVRRLQRATWLCEEFLNQFDDNGEHCK